MLSLDIDSLKVNKFNEVVNGETYEDESIIDFYRNQAVSLNSNLAVCLYIFILFIILYIYYLFNIKYIQILILYIHNIILNSSFCLFYIY